MVSSIQKLISEAPLLAIFVVFCAGALASISSCTIVRVPVAPGFIAGAAESKKRAVIVTFLFVSGLVAAYTVFGAFLGMVGRLAFTIIQCNKYIFYLLGFLLFVFGLFIAGLLKADVIMFLESKIRRIEDHINFVFGNMLITLGIYYLNIA